jgi:hypothetical protein
MEYHIYEIEYSLLVTPGSAVIAAESQEEASSLLKGFDDGVDLNIEVKDIKNYTVMEKFKKIIRLEVGDIRDTGFVTDRRGLISPSDLRGEMNRKKKLVETLLDEGSLVAAIDDPLNEGR